MRIALAPVRRSRIALVSLVDVIFILLFFFMLAAYDLDWRALHVDLARPAVVAAESLATPVEGLKVVMLANGDLYFRGRTASRAVLLAEVRGGPRDRPVVLVPARGVNVQALVGLVDALEPSGVRVLFGGAGAHSR